MSIVEDKLSEFENCIRRFNRADEIIFTLLTTNEHGSITLEDLEKVGDNVSKLNDDNLSRLYNIILEEVRPSNLFRQIHPNDFFAFLQRLGTLLSEVTIEANEADITLREVIGLSSSTGLWGSKGWRPSGQL